ncbi:MAG: GTP cyclohydrolase II [Proteobacteria bacterium]|nr:GTP cyclohydrolase II [Pseudomonadota bacterium]
MDCKVVAECVIPTKFSDNSLFHLIGFEINGVENQVVAFSTRPYKDLANKVITLRIHSACITSEIFGSLKCDCKEQLNLSLKMISKKENGLLIYFMNHEGRGIGINNKIKAYKFQESGLDTIQANIALGLDVDKRDFSPAVLILKYFNIKNVQLITNNPNKIDVLIKSGINIVKRIEQDISPNVYSTAYLETKINRMGHFMKQHKQCCSA